MANDMLLQVQADLAELDQQDRSIAQQIEHLQKSRLKLSGQRDYARVMLERLSQEPTAEVVDVPTAPPQEPATHTPPAPKTPKHDTDADREAKLQARRERDKQKRADKKAQEASANNAPPFN